MRTRRSLVTFLALPRLLALVVALVAGVNAPREATAQAPAAPAPVVLKIQASWPASLTIFDHLKFVAEVNVLKTPPDVLHEFLEAWDRIAAREAEKDPFFKKALESQRQYAAIVVPAKRFLSPPYDFAANHYWPEKGAARPAEKK